MGFAYNSTYNCNVCHFQSYETLQPLQTYNDKEDTQFDPHTFDNVASFSSKDDELRNACAEVSSNEFCAEDSPPEKAEGLEEVGILTIFLHYYPLLSAILKQNGG